MDQRTVLEGLGVIRLGVGAALVAAPAEAGRIWVGDDAAGRGTRVFARALGARDVVLGLALLNEVRDGNLHRASLHARTGVLADVADVAATLVARRHLQGSRRWTMPLIAAAVGAAGVLVWSVTEDDADSDEGDVDQPPVSAAEEAGIVDQQGAALTAIQGAVE